MGMCLGIPEFFPKKGHEKWGAKDKGVWKSQ